MWADIGNYLALSIIYSLIVFAMVETILRLWHVRKPSSVIKFRLLVLLLPPLAAVLVDQLFQERRSTLSAHNLVLFDSAKWLRLLGDDGVIVWLIFAILAAAGAAMLLWQTVFPALRQQLRREGAHTIEATQFPKLYKAITALFPLAPTSPGIYVLQEEDPLAYASGLRRSRVLISTRLIEMLDEAELTAVLAHEVSHVRRHDTGLGWLLFLLRGLMFYNPLATLVFSQISLDIERACDEAAVSLTNKPLALASALLKVYRAAAEPTTGVRYVGTSPGPAGAPPRGRPNAHTTRSQHTAFDKPFSARPPGGEVDRLARRPFRLSVWQSHARRALTEDRVKHIVLAGTEQETSHLHLRLALLSVASLCLMVLVI